MESEAEGSFISYTPEQVEQARTEWARRRTRQRVGFAAACVLLLLWAVAFQWNRQFMLSLPNWVRMLAMLLPGWAILYFVRQQSRCPGCNGVISTRTQVEYCPACGIKLV